MGPPTRIRRRIPRMSSVIPDQLIESLSSVAAHPPSREARALSEDDWGEYSSVPGSDYVERKRFREDAHLRFGETDHQVPPPMVDPPPEAVVEAMLSINEEKNEEEDKRQILAEQRRSRKKLKKTKRKSNIGRDGEVSVASSDSNKSDRSSSDDYSKPDGSHGGKST
ncbi:MAG: hypothetical protein Q9201_007186, partial [Fulgogasparrea decipioides]